MTDECILMEIRMTDVHNMQSSLTNCEAKLIKMQEDCIRMREALLHIAINLDVDISTPEKVHSRLAHLAKFASEVVVAGKRPGFESFLKHQANAAASG
jgi:hypothetical protein